MNCNSISRPFAPDSSIGGSSKDLKKADRDSIASAKQKISSMGKVKKKKNATDWKLRRSHLVVSITRVPCEGSDI